MTLTRRIALAGAMALSIIAPIAITGCDSAAPTATVITGQPTQPAANPTPLSTVQGTVPGADGTAGPGGVPTTGATVAPKPTPSPTK